MTKEQRRLVERFEAEALEAAYTYLRQVMRVAVELADGHIELQELLAGALNRSADISGFDYHPHSENKA